MHKFGLKFVAFTGLIALSGCGESSTSQDTSSSSGPASETEDVAATSGVDLSFADLTGDAVAGETVFAQCKACHALDEGNNGVGPSLFNVVGSQAGSADGFNYSDANANSQIIWTPENLFEYLEAPREYLPGTRMTYPGVKDPQDRADLIAYLSNNDG